MTVLLVSLLLACRPAAPPPPEPLDVSWIANVVREPAHFSSTLEQNGGREAWQAFHRGDWLNVRSPVAADAQGAVPSVAEHRAWAELSVFEGVLDRAQGDALLTLAEGWAKHSPDQPVPKWLLASAQRVAELRSDAPTAEKWRAQANAAGIVFDEANPKPFAYDQPPTLTIDAIRTCVGAAVDNGQLGSFWDATGPAALQQRYKANASNVMGVGLPEDLFGPIAEAVMAARPSTDDVEACHTLVSGMDTRLDAWSAKLAQGATTDGAALLHDLQLVQVGRSRTLAGLAVDALGRHHDACALYYAEQALDHADARAISPVNSPTVFAVIAAANVESGHVREALDALAPLRGAFPEAAGVIETIGDLAVQQGLDRTGLSREN